jgi:hypothetical protein
MFFAADCHFAVPDFFDRYEQAKAAASPVFYFWGHGYELVTDQDWSKFADNLAQFNADADAVCADLPDLFDASPA